MFLQIYLFLWMWLLSLGKRLGERITDRYEYNCWMFLPICFNRISIIAFHLRQKLALYGCDTESTCWNDCFIWRMCGYFECAFIVNYYFSMKKGMFDKVGKVQQYTFSWRKTIKKRDFHEVIVDFSDHPVIPPLPKKQ